MNERRGEETNALARNGEQWDRVSSAAAAVRVKRIMIWSDDRQYRHRRPGTSWPASFVAGTHTRSVVGDRKQAIATVVHGYYRDVFPGNVTVNVLRLVSVLSQAPVPPLLLPTSTPNRFNFS